MDWKTQVDLALNGRHPKLGRTVEFGLILLIIASAVLMGFETMPNPTAADQEAMFDSESVIVAIFTLEYVLRLIVSPERRSYAKSFYGIVDLVAIAPFYLALLLPWIGLGLDLRVIRVLRMLRLFRLLKMARYVNAVNRLALAWRSVKEEIVIFGATSFVLLYACALIIYQFENEAQPKAFSSVLDAMWWAAVTLTTVGYGDIYPVTFLGRLFTVVMLFIALGIIAVPTGLVASALTAIRAADKASHDTAASESRSSSNASKTSRE